MDKILKKISENKPVTIVIGLVLILFIAFSVVRCSQVHSTDETTESGDGTIQAEEDADSQLSADQIAKREGYSEDTNYLISLLKSQTWAAGGASPYLTFTDKTFTESGTDTESNTKAYVIDVTEKKTTKASNPETVVYTAAIETQDADFFLELSRETSENGEVKMSLSGSGFSASQDAYTPIKPSDQYKVSGLNSDVLKLVDGKEADLKKAVTEYCSQHYPTATNIQWSKTVDIDWDSNMVTIPLTVDNQGTSSFYVFYDKSAKTFTVQSTDIQAD